MNNVESQQPLPALHLMLHRRPTTVMSAQAITFKGRVAATVALSAREQSEAFSIDFETATQRLAELPRLFVEPDGAFVWVSANDVEPAWQLDGVVNDRAERVVAVEMKGTCPREPFEQMLGVFDWPEVPLLVQLVQAAVFLEVDEFFRLVAVGEELGSRLRGNDEPGFPPARE